MSWAGLRGAVPIVLATIPLAEGVDGAERLFDIVFVMVVIYTLLTGPTLPLGRPRCCGSPGAPSRATSRSRPRRWSGSPPTCCRSRSARSRACTASRSASCGCPPGASVSLVDPRGRDAGARARARSCATATTCSSSPRARQRGATEERLRQVVAGAAGWRSGSTDRRARRPSSREPAQRPGGLQTVALAVGRDRLDLLVASAVERVADHDLDARAEVAVDLDARPAPCRTGAATSRTAGFVRVVGPDLDAADRPAGALPSRRATKPRCLELLHGCAPASPRGCRRCRR